MIQLTKNLCVKADDNCYIVGNPRTRAGKGVVLDKPTYYSTMNQAVQGALKRAMRQGVADGSITTLRQFIQEQERLQVEFETLIAPLNSGQPRQEAVKTHQATETGKDIPQPLDSENHTYTVEWCDHEGNRHWQIFDNMDDAHFEAQALEKEFCYVVVHRETEKEA